MADVHVKRAGDNIKLDIQGVRVSIVMDEETATTLRDKLTEILTSPALVVNIFENGTWKVFVDATGEEFPQLQTPNCTLETAKSDPRVKRVTGRAKQ